MRRFADLRVALAAGATVVMPSRRAALAARARHARAMTAAGAQAWAAPDVLPLEAWLRRLHETLSLTGTAGDAAFLLSPEQERLLWIRVIGEDVAVPLQREHLARLAMQARRLGLGHDLDVFRVAAAAATPAFACFVQWCRRFTDHCRALGAVDRAAWLARAAAGPLPPQRGTVLVPGLADLPPVIRRLLTRLEACGLELAMLEPPAAGRAPEHAVYAHPAAECAAAVAWAAVRRAADPEAAVVLALGDPRQDRDVLERALGGLAPSDPLGALRAPRPYVLDAAGALHEVPLLRTALAWLRLGHRLHAGETGPLVMSPYLGGATAERLPRARLDAVLKSIVVESHSAAALAARCQGEGLACPDLRVRLERWRDLAARAPRRQSLQAWMALCEEALALAGWPGECALTAAEEQALKRWRQATDATAALDAVAAPCPFGEALSHLRSALAGAADFEPATPDAIEVMSLEDAAALRPEYVWVLGLHDAAWPRRADPNPLLPYGVQRAAGMPGTHPAADLASAIATLEGLTGGALDAVVSAAAKDGDLPLAPSASAGLAGRVVAPAMALRPAAWGAAPDDAAREPFPEASTVPPLPAERLGGGAALLKDQAACAFRAYAKHRLRAEDVDEAGPGLDASARGELVHGVLEKFWTQIGDRAGLLALDATGRAHLVAAAVATVIAAHPKRALFGAGFWQLEQARVAALVCEWLEGERQRPPFTVVAREAAFGLDLAGLPLRLRADRIDRLGSGAELLIDYKTGQAKRASWDPPRPDEPQLPLYALAQAQTLRGISFAKVRKGECRFEDFPNGIALHGESAERTAAWALALTAWRAELERLARDFQAGRAAVDPKRGAVTCRHCELALFCRVNEAGPRGGADEEGADDAF